MPYKKINFFSIDFKPLLIENFQNYFFISIIKLTKNAYFYQTFSEVKNQSMDLGDKKILKLLRNN